MIVACEAGMCRNDPAYARLVVQSLRGLPDVWMKVQMLRPETIASRTATRYDRTDTRNLTQRELFEGALSYGAWAEIKSYADEHGVKFVPSVFDHEAVEAAAAMGCDTLKIASGDLTYHALIAHAADVAQHVVLSTGAATEAEVEQAVETAWGAHPRWVTLLACHLAYPTSTTSAHLARVHALRDLHGWTCDVGYSDHTPGVDTFPLLAAMGASMVEKHYTIARGDTGDDTFAMTPGQLMRGLDDMQRTLAVMGEATLEPTPEEADARHGARRSAHARMDLSAGWRLEPEWVDFLRPATGLQPHQMDGWWGKTLTRPVAAGEPIMPWHFEDDDGPRQPVGGPDAGGGVVELSGSARRSV